MPGLGTIINVVLLVAGGLLGLAGGRFITPRIQDTLMKASGLCVLFIGLGGTMQKMLLIDGKALATTGTTMLIVSFALGSLIGEAINFPIQRSFVFRSKRPVSPQIAWYVVAFCIVTVIVNSINCIWVDVAGQWVAPWLYNIGTTVLNGGVSMVVFFFVNKIIFRSVEA